MEPKRRDNPLKGWGTFLSVLAAVLLGLASLLFFMDPGEIAGSFEPLSPANFALSFAVFLAGCLLAVFRWRACLGYRAPWSLSFHSMGVGQAGNLLIPGRAGEALRVFCLAELGVAPEYVTSAVVQERLADQLLRLLFIGMALFLAGGPGESALESRLLGVTLMTVVLVAALVALIRWRKEVAETAGYWLGRIPPVNGEMVSNFVHRTLADLGDSGRPGTRPALLWGAATWGAFTLHIDLVLRPYLEGNILAFAVLMMAFATPTAPTKPGVYHGVALAALMVLGADRTPALQAIIVLHLIQMTVFTLWGVCGWCAVTRRMAREREKSARPRAERSDLTSSPRS